MDKKSPSGAVGGSGKLGGRLFLLTGQTPQRGEKGKELEAFLDGTRRTETDSTALVAEWGVSQKER